MIGALPLWAWGLAAALAWGGVQHYRAGAAAAELQRDQAAAAVARERGLQARLDTTTRRLAAQTRITHDADHQVALARADAASAAGAVDRLQQRIAELDAGARGADSAAARAGATDQLGRALAACAGRYRDVAAAADQAVIAGRACERAYDALIEAPAP